MATRRRRQARKRGSIGAPFGLPPISPEVSRSLFGISLLVLGAVMLIAFLPGASDATLTKWFQSTVGPWFGSLRWLLPVLLLITGWYVEWGPGRAPGSGWGLTALGVAVAYIGLLGAAAIVAPAKPPLGGGGGVIGTFLAKLFQPLIGAPAAFVLLLAVGIVGVLLAFNLRLRDLVAPAMRTARWVGAATAESMRRQPDADPSTASASRRAAAAAGTATDPAVATPGGRRGARIGAAGATGSGSQTGIWGEDTPVPVPASAPVSATFAPPRTGPVDGTAVTGGNGRGPANGHAPSRDLDDVTDASDSPPTKARIEYRLPELTLLDEAQAPATIGGDETIHRRNEDIIIKKLASFDIEAQIVGRNAGPVVTQYEVQPAPHVKVSRIEGLADDLAMALAARSLRIEAPIPGKAAVGIEVPNKDFNVVALRGILEAVDFGASGSRLTFALGRDVAGRAQAVDLARMPHLLIAGATGSGKSVMVNALITSLLCHATPDEVRLILMDLKRVELAAYNDLPHLLAPVITEPVHAKSALRWAAAEMERRYQALARASSRNVKAYNETRTDPDDRLPYIVVVIDELADLMMREGKNVEDPIVRLAQKARATGIHMVLATQRPSVNVVTGLIKANFPSRIAFAMASQIDSRTILDAPGAEDLIGRGDMLYQPSDLPKPMRLQGVFVSDHEIGRIVQHWRDQVDGPLAFDEEILTFVDSEGDGGGAGGQFGWLRSFDVDDQTINAAELVTATGKASTSFLQTRLRLGFARAARVMDELERYGIVGPQDPHRPAAPRQIYGPDNWITSVREMTSDD
ncbi:MAG TPA: DNA translocase FtsK [Candidatus Limnocylindrales bacterium]